jgi:TLD
LTSNADRFALACTSHALNGPWFRLYTSSADGLSFNRLLKAILGYGGPTLFVIRSTTGTVFGSCTSAPWKEAKDFYGNTDCFLYQLKPTLAVYRPTGSASNFMYCNPSARSRGYDQQAHGIGFGGSIDQPRLFLPETLDDPCYASPRDLTFENGKLESSADSSFFVDSVEVWGVGGEEAVAAALAARTEKRALKDDAIQKARKVDKAKFLDDFREGTFDSKAFAHRQQVDGRGREDMEERVRDKSKEYEYAK